jgi:protein-S-isoprenylcysteine O-methyltransferase Ste14
LSGNDTLTIIWGSLILVLIAIYSLSSVAFGIRFSNLTHRGIITSGPYRYTKHPAYFSKNLSWWLIGIPFISATNDMLQVIQSCLMLMGLNLIYYLRAVTEERHLSWDETYRAYQRAMEKRGILRSFERLTSIACKPPQRAD